MNDSVNNNKWLLPIILAAMTFLTSALLMFGHVMTADKIAAIKLEKKRTSLQRLIPGDLVDNDFLQNTVEVYEPVKLGHRQTEQLYLGTWQGSLSVMAIPVTARNGYSGDIDILVGIKSNGDITAVEIIAHKETPGLGDLIDRNKSNWLEQFPDKSLNSPVQDHWKVKKDQGHFDQITAATITPRAVVGAIKQALLFHQQYLTDKGLTP